MPTAAESYWLLWLAVHRGARVARAALDIRLAKAEERQERRKAIDLLSLPMVKALPRHLFALPPRPGQKAYGIAGDYPLATEEQARVSLIRAERYLPWRQFTAVARKVKQLFPGIQLSRKAQLVVRRGY